MNLNRNKKSIVMEELKIKKHVTMVGAIQIGFSIIGLIGTVAVFFALRFAFGQVGDDDAGRTVLGFLSISLPLFMATLSALGLVAGTGLITYKPWARYLILIVSVLGFLNIPFGTLKGIYAIWVLQKDDAIKLFQEK
jgi:hypothetical protein